MTDEMRAIIDSKEKHIAVQSFAGVGKSSTMLEYVKSKPNENILFIVFSKEMRLDFTKRLKIVEHNCTVKTIH